ncbi:unnamed protein product [Pleuronectes platessa]|uniref:Uncharacterized protein n=1 Tax=Pleuronectes platessa TaxID=8262 RepID=A0A9N7Z656_PLEPL|nr:unnamed protein product [Pleuronectes platessa]
MSARDSGETALETQRTSEDIDSPQPLWRSFRDYTRPVYSKPLTSQCTLGIKISCTLMPRTFPERAAIITAPLPVDSFSSGLSVMLSVSAQAWASIPGDTTPECLSQTKPDVQQQQQLSLSGQVSVIPDWLCTTLGFTGGFLLAVP